MRLNRLVEGYYMVVEERNRSMKEEQMIDVEYIKQYCLSKYKGYEDHPFGEIPICYKLNGKIFAQLYPYLENYKITLKCEPLMGDFYRQMYPKVVERGYHCPPVQQPHWNTVDLNKIPKDILFQMIDEAYERVLTTFPKKVQIELLKG